MFDGEVPVQHVFHVRFHVVTSLRKSNLGFLILSSFRVLRVLFRLTAQKSSEEKKRKIAVTAIGQKDNSSQRRFDALVDCLVFLNRFETDKCCFVSNQWQNIVGRNSSSLPLYEATVGFRTKFATDENVSSVGNYLFNHRYIL